MPRKYSFGLNDEKLADMRQSVSGKKARKSRAEDIVEASRRKLLSINRDIAALCWNQKVEEIKISLRHKKDCICEGLECFCFNHAEFHYWLPPSYFFCLHIPKCRMVLYWNGDETAENYIKHLVLLGNNLGISLISLKKVEEVIRKYYSAYYPMRSLRAQRRLKSIGGFDGHAVYLTRDVLAELRKIKKTNCFWCSTRKWLSDCARYQHDFYPDEDEWQYWRKEKAGARFELTLVYLSKQRSQMCKNCQYIARMHELTGVFSTRLKEYRQQQKKEEEELCRKQKIEKQTKELKMTKKMLSGAKKYLKSPSEQEAQKLRELASQLAET